MKLARRIKQPTLLSKSQSLLASFVGSRRVSGIKSLHQNMLQLLQPRHTFTTAYACVFRHTDKILCGETKFLQVTKDIKTSINIIDGPWISDFDCFWTQTTKIRHLFRCSGDLRHRHHQLLLSWSFLKNVKELARISLSILKIDDKDMKRKRDSKIVYIERRVWRLRIGHLSLITDSA